jgi:hypothetical protein
MGSFALIPSALPVASSGHANIQPRIAHCRLSASMMWSTPRYVPLSWDVEARTHLLAAHGDGAGPLLRLLSAPCAGDVSVRYAAEPLAGTGNTLRLADASAGGCNAFATIEALLSGLSAELTTGHMGLRLFLAGSENFLGNATRIALDMGLGEHEIRRERIGSAARSVYCVHCKTTTPHIRTNVLRCPGCQRALMVRDHYSARLAAYMGFQVDAEVPGTIPPVEELYP